MNQAKDNIPEIWRQILDSLPDRNVCAFGCRSCDERLSRFGRFSKFNLTISKSHRIWGRRSVDLATKLWFWISWMSSCFESYMLPPSHIFFKVGMLMILACFRSFRPSRLSGSPSNGQDCVSTAWMNRICSLLMSPLRFGLSKVCIGNFDVAEIEGRIVLVWRRNSGV